MNFKITIFDDIDKTDYLAETIMNANQEITLSVGNELVTISIKVEEK